MQGSRLIDDAIAIWRAGVDAVRADRVVSQSISWENRWLLIHDAAYDLEGIQRIVIVGAGKATYGMLTGLAESFSRTAPSGISIQGWINVPDGVTEDRSVPFGRQERSMYGQLGRRVPTNRRNVSSKAQSES
jgi:hypothetical protein